MGAFADMRRRHHAKLAAGKIFAGVVGEFKPDLVVITGKSAANDVVFFNPKRKQHRHLEPLIDLPAIGHRLGHPHLAAIQQLHRVRDRLAHLRGDIMRLDFVPLLPGFKDDLFGFVHCNGLSWLGLVSGRAMPPS